MLTEEQKQKWDHFVEYANNNGFIHYIGNLSFASYRTGDVIKLVSDGKVAFIREMHQRMQNLL